MLAVRIVPVLVISRRRERATKVLFVCTANTYRSPMAQAIFDTLSEDEGLRFRAESTATEALEGTPWLIRTRWQLWRRRGTIRGPRRTMVNAEMVEVAESCSPWIRDRPSRSTCRRELAAGIHTLLQYRTGVAGKVDPTPTASPCPRTAKPLTLAVRACGTRGGNASETTKSQERARRRIKGTLYGLTARLSPNCCLAKTAYLTLQRVSCSYGTFLAHPFRPRVESG